MTKFQAVRGYIPDLNNIILLPFEQPVEFHVPKDERGMFHEKSRAGSYVGASLTHPASIQVWSHNTRRIITTASFRVKHVMTDPDRVFDRSVFRDEDDMDDSVITDIRPPESIAGPITRKRTVDLNRSTSSESLETSSIDSSISEELSENTSFQEGEAIVSHASVLQEGATQDKEAVSITRSYAQVLQEGAQTSKNLDSMISEASGPITRSKSHVITTVATLRTSDRLNNNVKVNYNEQFESTNNAQYRILVNANRINRKTTDKVVLAPSLLNNAGHGLFASSFIKEGSYPCTYGKQFVVDSNYMSVYDTVFEDKHGVAIGNRNKDYGCWCNDPLNDNKVNCIVVYDKNTKMYLLRARWDIEKGEELYIGYGESFWKHSYWTYPEYVKNRYPNITPHPPAPTEGGFEEYVQLPEGAPEDFPRDIFETKTKPWKQRMKRVQPDQEKRSGSKAMRISRVLASTFALNHLMAQKSDEDSMSEEELIEGRIRNMNQGIEVRRVAGKRVIMRTKAQKDLLDIMHNQLRKIKKNQSKKGIRKDNPTLAEAKKRSDWPLFQKAIEAELHQIAVEEKAHEDTPTERGNIPRLANIIGSMLVLTVKRLPNGKVDKYKARLVALGNHQKESSYEQIKAGTVRGSTVKMLVELQAKNQAHSMVLDIKGAYLKSVIQEPEKEKL